MIGNDAAKTLIDEREQAIRNIDRRIEQLRVQYTLFFSGELDIPPEPEREALEKVVRKLLYTGHKAARLNLLAQNVSSKFTLYNNMWLKKLNELETGMTTIKKKRAASPGEQKQPWTTKVYGISLNSEDSFNNLYTKYCDLFPKASSEIPLNKNKLIDSIKTKMISSNLIDAKAAISVSGGKLKIRIKK